MKNYFKFLGLSLFLFLMVNSSSAQNGCSYNFLDYVIPNAPTYNTAFEAAFNAMTSNGNTGGELCLPSGTFVVQSSPGASAINIPTGVVLRLKENTIIADIGTGYTITLGLQTTNNFSGIIGGILQDGLDGEGGCLGAIRVEKGHRLVVRPKQIRGTYSEAAVLLDVNGGRIVYSDFEFWVPKNNLKYPRTVLLVRTAPSGGFVTGNKFSIFSTGPEEPIIIDGYFATNTITGAMQGTPGGVAAISSRENARECKYNFFDKIRLEGFENQFNLSSVWENNLLIGNYTFQYIDEGKGNTIITSNNDFGRSPAAYKTVSSGIVELETNIELEFFRITVPRNRRLRVYSGQCHATDGEKSGDYIVQVFNVSKGVVLYEFSNQTYKRGYPLLEMQESQDQTIAFRILNECPEDKKLYGSVTFSVDGE